MSASEEFLRLVDLRGDLECARTTFDDLVEGDGGVDPGAADEALDEVLRVKKEYARAVAAYAASHDTPVLMVEVAVDEACDALARHDRLMAAIEDTLRERR